MQSGKLSAPEGWTKNRTAARGKRDIDDTKAMFGTHHQRLIGDEAGIRQHLNSVEKAILCLGPGLATTEIWGSNQIRTPNQFRSQSHKCRPTRLKQASHRFGVRRVRYVRAFVQERHQILDS